MNLTQDSDRVALDEGTKRIERYPQGEKFIVFPTWRYGALGHEQRCIDSLWRARTVQRIGG